MFEGHAGEDGDKGQPGYGTQVRLLEIERKEQKSMEHPNRRTARSGIDSGETGSDCGRLEAS